MTRQPGSPATNLPSCPAPGHQTYRVTKDGVYGVHRRQRYRCIAPDGTFHRFTPILPREPTESGVCDTCDSQLATHQGPAVPRQYATPLREIAAAFVAVGQGSSYLKAADRARGASDRPRLFGAYGGQLVAEWLDSHAAVVLDAHAETAWPTRLVLDSTKFMVTNTWNGQRSLAFNVLGAYGYPGHKVGRRRVWALQAYHNATAVEWEDFLRRLDCTVPPKLVVCDGAPAIANAVRNVWPVTPGPSLPMPFVYRCEYHLRKNARDAMDDDWMGGPKSRYGKRLDTAFVRDEGWEEFSEFTKGFFHTSGWVAGVSPQVPYQISVRHLLPRPRSTAALDTHLGTVRDLLDSRSFVLRNAARTNLMLGLIRLHLNGDDNEREYQKLLRLADEAAGGKVQKQRTGYDPKGHPSLR
jgi:hypothetical protein